MFFEYAGIIFGGLLILIFLLCLVILCVVTVKPKDANELKAAKVEIKKLETKVRALESIIIEMGGEAVS